ncbi:aminotransferase class IV [Mangrovibacterium diazotrophicum]|uniref:branched-chain-amino-acid transaminase n=1 Tax=Mangrovibacterium diazotrophicum TaxID=1261403 RepID=A0A419VUZ5_9BACT|nr:aminotransferase class IV [Mangrovibacterium diazotrophicum]RKD85955.1 branched-subunit amino acid aminotransferase/4-amino-4-deoxychorismate lyase [Mangrovibacterium diazotrophicum]
MAYFLYNGNFHSADETIFSPIALKQFLFEDQLRVIKSRFLFWDEHLQLLQLHFKLFNLKVPAILENEGKELKRQIERSITKNKYFHSTLVRISFFKREKQIDYLIELVHKKESAYVFNPSGYALAPFTGITKSDSPLSTLASGSRKLWEMANAHQDDPDTKPILLDGNLQVLETPGSNIYLIKDQTVRTPSPLSGAYLNPAKRIIKKIAENFELKYWEDDAITLEDLEEADEVFLADDLNGVQFIRAFGPKRYFRKQATAIADEFNRLLIH